MIMDLQGGTSIYYEIYGDGIPLVMLHGWGVDYRILSGPMEPLFGKELSGFKRIYIDLPGMGQSKAGAHIKTSDEMLDALYTFLDQLIPGQRYVVMGESYGGYLARGMVCTKPSQVAGVILLCPAVIPGYRKGHVVPLCVMEQDEAFLDTLSAPERKSFEYMNVILTQNVWLSYKADIYDALPLQNTHFLNEVLNGAFSFDVDKLVEPYTAPSLIITGKQDTEVGYRDQFDLMRIYTNATYIALNRAGHNLQIEQPQLFTSVVGGWLADNMKDFTSK